MQVLVLVCFVVIVRFKNKYIRYEHLYVQHNLCVHIACYSKLIDVQYESCFVCLYSRIITETAVLSQYHALMLAVMLVFHHIN